MTSYQISYNTIIIIFYLYFLTKRLLYSFFFILVSFKISLILRYLSFGLATSNDERGKEGAGEEVGEGVGEGAGEGAGEEAGEEAGEGVKFANISLYIFNCFSKILILSFDIVTKEIVTKEIVMKETCNKGKK